ncbi:hypothetical protein [uncultured Tenacibaculum sp.]|uniref:hypothetical protein n=1 Tax=uncultured Tenacibaculum sp. TaxID=174713 RepID=UPI00261D339B|nr:hypothetical protein [uncultured Tenacibaculum sp.]
MKKTGFKKEKISIELIGKQRFWFGVIAGVTTSIAISLIFNRIREIIRFLTSVSEDLLIFEPNELSFFNYFFASLSTVLGLSITIWIWMGSPLHKRKKHKLYKQQIRTNTQLFFWLALFLTAQLGCLFLFLILGEVSNYFDHPINLYKDHALLFILIPIVIFTQNWFLVRRIYKTGKWIFISLIVSTVIVFTLTKTTTVDQNIVNHNYFTKHKLLFSYTEKAISKAEIDYGIKFDNKAITALKRRKSSSSVDQIWNIKHAFSRDQKVSIDTIVIQKILIHNLKARGDYRYHGEARTLTNWDYALPKDILKQINYFKSTSNETKELFEVLKEEILLVNKSKIILDDSKDFSYHPSDKEKNELKANIMLVEQLIEVRDILKNQEKYADLSILLPEIKNHEQSQSNE